MDLNVPAQLRAGDTWEWTSSLSDYPAPTWSLAFHLVNACEAPDAIAAVPSGSDHAVSVSASTTADIEPGRYQWIARATSGTTIKTVGEGWVDVLHNPADQQKFDPRSDARRLLDAVTATLQGRATMDQQAMAINGRSISRIPLSELVQWRDSLRAEVAGQEDSETKGAGRDILVRVRSGR